MGSKVEGTKGQPEVHVDLASGPDETVYYCLSCDAHWTIDDQDNACRCGGELDLPESRHRETELARHALGLDGRRTTSYRNYFVCGGHSADHAAWMHMVDRGDAVHFDGKRLQFGGDDLFKLTRKGAIMALRLGERLDPEDFLGASTS